MSVSLEEAHDLFFPSGGTGERHIWRTVKAVNSDGSLDVLLNQSVATRCASICSANVGDRVLVLVTGSSAVVVGKKVG